MADGADAGRIRLRIEGAEALRLDSVGDLLIETAAGVIRQRKPSVFQNGRTIAVAYTIPHDHTIGLGLGR